MSVNGIINSIYELPQVFLNTLIRLASEVECPKHFHLFLENRKGIKSYFIKKGIVRTYIHKDDKDVTFWFGQEGDLISPLQTLFAGLGEYTNIELLEGCALYRIDLEQLRSLYYTDIHIANWGRKYAEYVRIKSGKSFIARQFKTSLERYQGLTDEYPSVTQRVQLDIVASYLGISRVNLSRIRTQIKQVIYQM